MFILMPLKLWYENNGEKLDKRSVVNEYFSFRAGVDLWKMGVQSWK